MSVSAEVVVHSAAVIDDARVAADGWVAFGGGLIVARGDERSWKGLATATTTVIDAGGRLLIPGLIDIHQHGGGGVGFDEPGSGSAGFDAALEVHRTAGTTRSMISVVSDRLPRLQDTIARAAARSASDPTVLGIHVEGPFLSARYRGAHSESALIDPSPSAVEALLEAADGHMRAITIAPERPGAMDAIRRLVAAGVAVAIGHTEADYDLCRVAFDEGASILTHAFNGMPGAHHRRPGPVLAAIDAGVFIEVIADGHHVSPHVVRALGRLAPDRMALVSDAMSATGRPPGAYRLGALDIDVTADGVARDVASGSLAGSTATLVDELRVLAHAGVALADAVRSATAVPAHAIGRTDIGTLRPGSVADVVVLARDLSVDAVWVAGACIALHEKADRHSLDSTACCDTHPRDRKGEA